jgi:hypothetical protein
MARLKVYQTQLGFYDAIIAAPSQKAAAAAWRAGMERFRHGFAHVTEEPDAVKAAIARPGTVLRRPVGSKIPFSENPPLPKVPKGRKPH